MIDLVGIFAIVCLCVYIGYKAHQAEERDRDREWERSMRRAREDLDSGPAEVRTSSAVAGPRPRGRVSGPDVSFEANLGPFDWQVWAAWTLLDIHLLPECEEPA